jgi:hypothetical protein
MLPDIWVRDTGAGTTTLVSVNAGNTATGNDQSVAPAISSDGRRVAFESRASDLVAGGDLNGHVTDVFVRDVVAAATQIVSRPPAAATSGNAASIRAAIDGSGTRIAFETNAPTWSPATPTARPTSCCATRWPARPSW